MTGNADDRSALPHRFEIPSRTSVLEQMRKLVDGRLSSQEVADWANEYLRFDDPQVYPEVRDDIVREALVLLSGADMMESPTSYLHGPEDYKAWELQFRESVQDDPE